MKIKEVCEQTKLTSRTVRLYIEEKLIFPNYSENYLGRKSFDFSDNDVQSLLDIATLRKFGFTIAEIRKIIETKSNSVFIIKEICNRKENTIKDETEMLSALSQLNDGEYYTIEEIANALNFCNETPDLPKDDTESTFLLLLKNPKQLIKKIFNIIDKVLLFASFVVSIYFIIYYFSEWKYPHFTNIPKGMLCLLLTAMPAIIILLLWICIKVRTRKQVFGIGWVSSIIMFISLLPICVIGLIRPVESMTTDMSNYREIDETFINENSFYNELFPTRPEGAVKENNRFIYPNSNYYYRCKATFDYTVDIYAEWSLNKKEFNEEVDRVTKLYSAYEMLEVDNTDYHYTKIKNGDFTCLIRYDAETPFIQEKDDYSYFIFAYDKEHLRVRYILCHSDENGAEQPYYLQLDW